MSGITFDGNVVLRADDNERHQFVYASQNYGTLYAIYARFKITPDDIIDQIDLEIINYKGLVNIGFLKEPNHQIESEIVDEKFLNFKIPVIGIRGVDKVTLKKQDLNGGVPVDVSKIVRINIDRILHRFAQRNNGVFQGVFDNEFRYRSGKENDGRTIRKGMRNSESVQSATEDPDNMNLIDVDIQLVSANCHSSTLKAII